MIGGEDDADAGRNLALKLRESATDLGRNDA